MERRSWIKNLINQYTKRKICDKAKNQNTTENWWRSVFLYTHHTCCDVYPYPRLTIHMYPRLPIHMCVIIRHCDCKLFKVSDSRTLRPSRCVIRSRQQDRLQQKGSPDRSDWSTAPRFYSSEYPSCQGGVVLFHERLEVGTFDVEQKCGPSQSTEVLKHNTCGVSVSLITC